MIERQKLLARIRRALKRSRVVALIGPRQSGKTTLAREIVAAGSVNYFDLENPASLARLEQPLTALESLRGTVAIDEIQHRSDLFPILRVLADRKPLPARFLIFSAVPLRTCCANPRSPSRAGLKPSLWQGWVLPKSAQRLSIDIGSAARSRCPFLREPMTTARRGVNNSFRPFSNATCRSSVSIFLRLHYCVSGPWSPTATAGSGIRRTQRDR